VASQDRRLRPAPLPPLRGRRHPTARSGRASPTAPCRRLPATRAHRRSLWRSRDKVGKAAQSSGARAASVFRRDMPRPRKIAAHAAIDPRKPYC